MRLKLRTLSWKKDETFARINEEHWSSWISARLGSEWKNMLDLGSGPGSRTAKLADERRFIVCVDTSKEHIEHGHKIYREIPNFHHVLGDACSLPFKDSTFDIVYSWAALHHFPNTRRSLVEVYRVLKPGGKILLVEPGHLNPFATPARTFFPSPFHEPSEKPFIPSMLEKSISQHFVNVEVRHFSMITYVLPFLLSRLGVISNLVRLIATHLVKLDDRLSSIFKEFAGVIAVKAEKPAF